MSIKHNGAVYICLCVAFLLIGCPRKELDKSRPQLKVVAALPVTIDALNRVIEGVKEEMLDMNINFITLSAEGDSSKIDTVLKAALSGRPDYLISVGTQVTDTLLCPQYRQNIPKTIATAISAPEQVQSLIEIGVDPPRKRQIAIVSDVPKAEMYELLAGVVASPPLELKRVGIIFNPSEPNSKYTAERSIDALKGRGVAVFTGNISSAEDVRGVTADLIRRGSQAVIIPHDKYATQQAATIVNICHPKRIVTLSLDEGTLTKHGVALAISVDYKDVGRETGRLIKRMITEGVLPESLPVSRPPRARVYGNKQVMDNLQIVLRPDVVVNADR